MSSSFDTAKRLLLTSSSVFGIMAGVLVSESEANGDASVIEQTVLFLRSIIKTFEQSRLFIQLFRKDAVAGPASKDPHALGKALSIVQSADRVQVPTSTQAMPKTILETAIEDLDDLIKRPRQVIEQVLDSFERFVSVADGPISSQASIDFGAFITRLGKLIAEWDSYEFNPNPLLRACARVLDMAPPLSAGVLAHQISTLLHLCLFRLDVDIATVDALLHSSDRVAQLPPDTQISNQPPTSENSVRTVLFDVAGPALHGQAMTPSTLNTLITFINERAFSSSSRADGISPQEKHILQSSAPGCVLILLRVHGSISSGRVAPAILLSIFAGASTLLLRAEAYIPRILAPQLVLMTSEAAIVQLGVFIPILLASLSLTLGDARKRLIGLYPVLARSAALCLRASADMLSVADVAGEGAENLSRVFTAFQLAVLAVHEPAASPAEGCVSAVSRSVAGDDAVDLLWSRIWPDWYRVLSLSIEETCVNAVSHPSRTRDSD